MVDMAYQMMVLQHLIIPITQAILILIMLFLERFNIGEVLLDKVQLDI